tara:strand:- start:782 stop:1783 length:1002 start_codon:yes stop_codon:yes gene_type:complete
MEEEFDVETVDKENMYDVLKNFPKQMQEAARLGKNVKITDKIDNIIITGMGGSALPGEILKSFFYSTSIPIFVNKGYTLPEFTNMRSLVFVISYSGNTEETIYAYRNALRKGARIVAISSGGKLEELSTKQRQIFIKVPSGIQPRSGYAYQFFPILNVLMNSKIIGDVSQDIEKTIETLKKPIFEERAKDIAIKLEGKIPLIYSSDKLFAIAYKWKINFNENSKVHAFCNMLPELNHNEIVGYTQLEADYHVILIKDEDDHMRVKKRFDITKDIIKKSGVSVTEIMLKGGSILTKIFSAIYIGDLASYYLALKYGIDPTPVKIVEELKRRLKE